MPVCTGMTERASFLHRQPVIPAKAGIQAVDDAGMDGANAGLAFTIGHLRMINRRGIRD